MRYLKNKIFFCFLCSLFAINHCIAQDEVPVKFYSNGDLMELEDNTLPEGANNCKVMIFNPNEDGNVYWYKKLAIDLIRDKRAIQSWYDAKSDGIDLNPVLKIAESGDEIVIHLSGIMSVDPDTEKKVANVKKYMQIVYKVP